MHGVNRIVFVFTDVTIIAEYCGIVKGNMFRQDFFTWGMAFAAVKFLAGEAFFMAKRVYTDEQRQRNREYLRAYRAAHPERVKAWRDAYIMRRAARLRAAAEAEGGVESAGH